MDLNQSKRGYHLVVFRKEQSPIKDFLCKEWKMKEIENIIEDEYSTNLLRFKSSKQYFRGEGELSFYFDKNNRPPFIYDIILLENNLSDLIILCIPFKKLAIDIVNTLIEKLDILKRNSFIKVDLIKLIESNRKYTDLRFNNIHFVICSIILKSIGESYLSSLKLLGKKPLESILYKKYIEEMITSKAFGIKRIVFRCERSFDIASSMQIDRYGNYKFCINNKGKNIVCIFDIFDLLNHLNCLVETSKNPTNLIDDEE